MTECKFVFSSATEFALLRKPHTVLDDLSSHYPPQSINIFIESSLLQTFIDRIVDECNKRGVKWQMWNAPKVQDIQTETFDALYKHALSSGNSSHFPTGNVSTPLNY